MVGEIFRGRAESRNFWDIEQVIKFEYVIRPFSSAVELYLGLGSWQERRMMRQ